MTSILEEGAVKLAPCPFCGSDNLIVRADLQSEPSGPVISVRCGDCRSSNGLWFAQADAVSAWNRRSPSTDIPAPLPGSGWKDIASAPKDGTEFQAWCEPGVWEPRCRVNPDSEAVEIWGRVDYDEDGWAVYPHLRATHWQPPPASPAETQAVDEVGE